MLKKRIRIKLTTEAAKKAAQTRSEKYANASLEEKARIDEIRHLAAIKAHQTRKLKLQKIPRPHRKVDWTAAVERAQNTEKSALAVTKWRLNQLDISPRWQLVEFTGKKGHESIGIVDILAIRKDHERMVKKVGLKPGDLFEMILIQVKGGGASWPSLDDIRRLQVLRRYYNAKEVILAELRDFRLNFYRLNQGQISTKNSWIKLSSLIEVFQ